MIVYGATNNVGKQVSKVLAKHGYSLVLIDVNLDKLQQVKNELIRVFPHLTQAAEDQRVELVNLNFAIWRDSTSLEARVREIFQVPGTAEQGKVEFRDIRALINAGSMANGAWQVCEDKLLHEIHYDQVFAYLGCSLIGPTLLLNFMVRLVVYSKQPCLVLNILRSPVHPRDRTPLPMRLLRRLYFPLYYHKLMQRLNVLHYGVNDFIAGMCE